MFKQVKFPYIYRMLHPDFIFSVKNDKKKIFLTFDDGPSKETTDKILDVLGKFNIKATYFCLGENVEKFPELYKRISDAGHAIGNHGYHHFNGWKISGATYIKNVLRSEEIIGSKLFRPPYGKITPKQARILSEMGFKIIMWDLMSWDFDPELSESQIIEKVLKNANTGSIIVFHDNEKTDVRIENILGKIIDSLQKRGFIFDTINS